MRNPYTRGADSESPAQASSSPEQVPLLFGGVALADSGTGRRSRATSRTTLHIPSVAGELSPGIRGRQTR